MKIAFLIFTFLTPIFSFSMTVRDLHNTIKGEVKFSNYPNINAGDYYTASLSEGFRIHQIVYGFIGDNGKLTQFAIEFYVCNLLEDPFDELDATSKAFIQSTLSKILGTNTKLPNDIFENPQLKSVKHSIKPLKKKIRIQRTIYKCDTKGGRGFRLDAFL